MRLIKCDKTAFLMNLYFSKESYVSFLIVIWYIIHQANGKISCEEPNPDPSPYHVNLFALLGFLYLGSNVIGLMLDLDDLTKAKIVALILDKKTEQALDYLSKLYKVDTPQIVVGTIKKKRRTVYAVYVVQEKKIYALNSEIFYNPFVILHEYYHHIRSKLGTHRGSEKYADMYAQQFIDSYMRIVEKLNKNKSHLSN